MDAEQLRDLIEDDDDPDPRLEADEHRLGDEARDEAEAQQPREDQERAREKRQRRRCRQRCGRVARFSERAELGGDEDRERRRAADAEQSRRAEQRVEHHRAERRVQADLHRKPGDRRVRHGLRDHDRRRDQAGDEVGAQPLALVVGEPVGKEGRGRTRLRVGA
jgi:hypothetical protein